MGGSAASDRLPEAVTITAACQAAVQGRRGVGEPLAHQHQIDASNGPGDDEAPHYASLNRESAPTLTKQETPGASTHRALLAIPIKALTPN